MNTKEQDYTRLTVEGQKKTRWICGCFETVDGFFKFCPEHNDIIRKTIEAQIDELDMTLVVKDDDSGKKESSPSISSETVSLNASTTH